MRPVQFFSKEYLDQCRKLSPTDIVRFLDDFRRLHSQEKSKSRLISMKVPERLLRAFRLKAKAKGQKYQTQIKVLMQDWVDHGD
jgi:predicted DNA binding CopG/RHH family protein